MATSFVELQSAATATGNGVAVDITGKTRVGVQVTGITTATVTFEVSIDGTNFVAVGLAAAATGTLATTATANGVFYGEAGQYRLLRARISAYTSGTITVTALLSEVAA